MSKKNINIENQSIDEASKIIDNINDDNLNSSEDNMGNQIVDEISKTSDNQNENELDSSNNGINDQSIDETSKKYVVVHEFKDLEDSDHIYSVNDVYPHEKINDEIKINALSESRITALMTTNNKIGKILIKLVEK